MTEKRNESQEVWLSVLQTQLSRAHLPGRKSHRLYSPDWAYGRHFGPILEEHFQAAVVICLVPSPTGWYLPLTKRPTTLPDHPGQISLPGGRIEPGESVEEAALRELSEELGVELKLENVLGRLSSLYVYSSRHHVTPVVAYAPDTPRWRPSAEEVERILEVPLETLRELAVPQRQSLIRGSVELTFPAWKFQEEVVWGATAMILNEFRHLVGPDLARV